MTGAAASASPHAYWWIRQAVSRAVAEQSRTIRLPVHIIEQLTGCTTPPGSSRSNSVARHARRRLGRRSASTPSASVTPSAPRKSLSPSSSRWGEPRGDPGRLHRRRRGETPSEEAEEEVLAASLTTALRQHLKPREAEVIRLRFGLGDQRERTLGEVGEVLGISRERARQIEADAMRKLRQATPFLAQFKEYAE